MARSHIIKGRWGAATTKALGLSKSAEDKALIFRAKNGKEINTIEELQAAVNAQIEKERKPKSTMRPLVGSEKQVPIAETIRQERITSINKAIAEMRSFVQTRRELGDSDAEISKDILGRDFQGGRVSVGKNAYISDSFNLGSALSFGRIEMPAEPSNPDKLIKIAEYISSNILPKVNSAGWWIDNNSGSSSSLAGAASKGKIKLTSSSK